MKTSDWKATDMHPDGATKEMVCTPGKNLKLRLYQFGTRQKLEMTMLVNDSPIIMAGWSPKVFRREAPKEDVWESGMGWAEQTVWCYLQELSGTVARALESMVPEH